MAELLQTAANKARQLRDRVTTPASKARKAKHTPIDTAAIDHELEATAKGIRTMVAETLAETVRRDEQGHIMYLDIDRERRERLATAIYNVWAETHATPSPASAHPAPAEPEEADDHGPMLAGFEGQPDDPNDSSPESRDRRTPIDKAGDKVKAFAAKPPTWAERLMGV